ncbi:MAG: serine protease [Oligoflexales bacterium]
MEQYAGTTAVRCVQISELGACASGTFVNPTTLITGAHCVRSDKNEPYHVSVEGRTPAAIYADESFFDNWTEGRHEVAKDLAVVVFNEPVGNEIGINSYPPVTSNTAEQGELVWIFGYGLTDSRDNNSGGKLYRGSNTIKQVTGGEITLNPGVHWADTETPGRSAPLPGDSGGALIRAAPLELIGVTSTSWYYGEEGESSFVDLTSKASRRLFREAIRCDSDVCAANFPGSGVHE